jgi:hypothetical protein
LTDLRRTRFENVVNNVFRLFVPIKHSRGRLPTSLPEFHADRFSATLSDSPVTAASRLGGTWPQHNLAAILHVAACNLRCTYCYVDYGHLSGKDSFLTNPEGIVSAFENIRTTTDGVQPTILRISGGEPLLLPMLIPAVHAVLVDRGLSSVALLKVESNLTALPRTYLALSEYQQSQLRNVAPKVALHATLHNSPSQPLWPQITEGIKVALDLGFDLYPSIGGTDWTEVDLLTALSDLQNIHPSLPFRLAIRPFTLAYDVLKDRRNLPPDLKGASRNPIILWNQILVRERGIQYLAVPRHEITLS